jgi:hypothetical protein
MKGMTNNHLDEQTAVASAAMNRVLEAEREVFNEVLQ